MLFPWIVATAAAGDPAMSDFSCETAPAALGFPQGTATRCTPFPNLASLYSVVVSDPSLPAAKAFVVAVRDGAPIRERGTAAAIRFLREAGYEKLPLEVGEVKSLFHALDAWPPGFGKNEQSPHPATLTTRPLELTVFAFPRAGTGHAAAPKLRRARLAAGPDGRLAWTIAEDDGAGGFATLEVVRVE